MPRPDGRKLFKVHILRKRQTGKPLQKTAFTVADSPDQARRFVRFRNPGFKVKRVREN